MKTRRCRKCNSPTPLDQFEITKNGNRRYVCPICVRLRLDERRAKRLRRLRFNFTPELYEALLLDQGGRCAICGQFSARTLHMDHDHETGQPRKLLCSQCNTGLGMFRDDPILLKRATEYLIVHKARWEREQQEQRRAARLTRARGY